MSYHHSTSYPAYRGKDAAISGAMIVVFLISFIVSGGFFFTNLSTEVKTIDIVNFIPYDAEKIPLTRDLLMEHQALSLYERSFDAKFFYPFLIALAASILTGVLLLALTKKRNLTPEERDIARRKIKHHITMLGICFGIPIVLLGMLILTRDKTTTTAPTTPPTVTTVKVKSTEEKITNLKYNKSYHYYVTLDDDTVKEINSGSYYEIKEGCTYYMAAREDGTVFAMYPVNVYELQ